MKHFHFARGTDTQCFEVIRQTGIDEQRIYRHIATSKAANRIAHELNIDPRVEQTSK